MNLKLSRHSVALALIFACTPIAAAAHSNDKDSRTSGFVTTPDNIRIHYIEAGTQSAPSSSPSILFIPGWTMPAWIWDSQIDYFSKKFRVVAIDPRSQADSTMTDDGDSPTGRAADIEAVIQSLHLSPVILVGWSQGVSDVAAYFNRYRAKSVAGFVLVDGFAGMDISADMAKGFVAMDGQLLTNREKFTEMFVRNMYKTPQTDEYIARVEKSALRTPTAIAVTDTMAMLNIDNRDAMKQIDKPTLILTPKGGFSAQFEEAMHAIIPNSELEEMEGVGHALFVDKPDAFNERVDRFITARITAPSGSAQQTPATPTASH
jgi:pimeloyl-ACP methyl ester carboxylesterase